MLIETDGPAEIMVLLAALADADIAFAAAATVGLAAEDFADRDRGAAWRVLGDLHAAGVEPNGLALRDGLLAAGADEGHVLGLLADLTEWQSLTIYLDDAALAHRADLWAETIRRAALARRLDLTRDILVEHARHGSARHLHQSIQNYRQTAAALRALGRRSVPAGPVPVRVTKRKEGQRWTV